jgi:hypothetical protein
VAVNVVDVAAPVVVAVHVNGTATVAVIKNFDVPPASPDG